MSSECHDRDDSRLAAVRSYWDEAAPTFDNEPDHGLRSDAVRAAWAHLLREWLPESSTAVLDVGCGTGSLSVLTAEFGHAVFGIDLSPAMIGLAKRKAEGAGLQVHFAVMDAAGPGLRPESFDVVLCRHLLWSFPHPAPVLEKWRALLRPGGRLILIEGFWYTGGGLHAAEIERMLPGVFSSRTVQDLGAWPQLWGAEVTDERFALIASLPV